MAESKTGDDGPLYIGTMLVLSLLTLAMTVIVHRAVGRPIGLAWLTSAVFALCTVVSLVNPHLGVYLLLLLVVAGRIEGPAPTALAASPASDLCAARWTPDQPKCAPPVTGSGEASASASVNGTALPMKRRIWFPVINRYGNIDPAPRRIRACSGSGSSEPVMITLPNRRPFKVAGSAP